MPRPPGTGPEPSRRNTSALETPRLDLTLPRSGDTAELYGLIHRNERITAGLMWNGPERPSDLGRFLDAYPDYTFEPHGHHWVIRDRGELTGTPARALGAIGIRPGPLPGRSDIGYWLGEPYWGRGVMTEAVAAVVDHGFEQLNMQRIEAGVFLTNPASGAVLAKVGFRLESIQRSSLYKAGQWIDSELWVILRTDWRLAKR